MATPTVRRLQLGNELAHLRDQAGLSQEAVARHVEKTQARIAKIEAGRADIDAVLLAALLDLYGIADRALREFYLALRRNNGQRGRWSGYRRVYHHDFRIFVDIEEDAEQIQTVEAESVPPLLQIDDYMRAQFRAAVASGMSIDEAVTARNARKSVLSRDFPVEYAVVMSESSLRRQYGDSRIMRDQVDHVIEVSTLPNVIVQVLPFTATLTSPVLINYNFTLFKIPAAGTAGPLEVAYTEVPNDCRYLDRKDDVRAHGSMWARLSAAALAPGDTRDWLHALRRQYN